MDYRAAVARVKLTLESQGGEIAVDQLILARAVDLLDPGSLNWNGRNFTHRGAPFFQATNHVGRILAVPGVALYRPTETPGLNFRLNVSTIDGWAFNYGLGNLSALLGAPAANVIKAMDSLWSSRVAGLGLVDVERVRKCLAAGLLVVPVAASTLQSIAPTYPVELLTPAGDGWAVPIAEFKPVLTSYNSGNLALAAAACRDSEAAADRWEIVASIVEAVRDAPLTAIGYAGQGIGYLLMTNWRLFALVGVVGALYLYRGKLGSLAKTVSSSALKKTGGAL